MRILAKLLLSVSTVMMIGAGFGTTYRSGDWYTKTFDTNASYFKHCQTAGTCWTDAQMVNILGAHPGTHLGFLPYKSYSGGSAISTGMGTMFNSLAASYPHPRIVVDHRPDLMWKLNPASVDTYKVATTNQRYCTAGTPNNCTTWEGYVTTCQGGSNPGTSCVVGDAVCTGTCGAANEVFNTDWIMRVPKAEHTALMTARWGGDDPYCTGAGAPYASCAGATTHTWDTKLDLTAIRALANSTNVPALYAEPIVSTDKLAIGQVVMDLRIPAARSWKVKQFLKMLSEYGITGQDEITVFWAYKSGFYSYEPNPALNYDNCRAVGDRAYAGKLWPEAQLPSGCNSYINSSSPLHDTQYGLGEYQSAINAYYTELIAALDAAGLGGVKLMVQNVPPGGSTTMEQEIPALTHSRRFAGQILPVETDPLP